MAQSDDPDQPTVDPSGGHAVAAVTGALRFGGDLSADAVLHFVRSDVAAATIATLDIEAAKASAGVLAVYTAADFDLAPYGPAEVAERYRQPVLAATEVRHVGERLAVIVATTEAEAADAAERVVVTYDLHKPRLDPTRAALTFTATEQLAYDDQVHPPTVEVITRNPRIAAAPLEPVTAVAEPDGDTTVLRIGTQTPDATHQQLCAQLGLDPDELRVEGVAMGGGFGGKATGGAPELAVLVSCARRLGRAIRYVEPRSVNLNTMVGRDQLQRLSIRADPDGLVTSLDVDILCDAGAYAAAGALAPATTALLASGPYMVRSVHTHTTSVQTNTAPTGAVRAPGRAEAAALLERGMDLLAHELSLDPAELRRRNLLRPFDFPYKTASGALYDLADHRATLDAALALVGADSVRAAQARLRDAQATRCLGLGVATWVDATGGQHGEQHSCASLDRDGTVRIIAGSADAGQGHAAVLASLARDTLGLDAAVVVETATSEQPITSIGGFGSRTAQIVGSAVLSAVRELRRKIRAHAAGLLGVTPDEVMQDGFEFHVRGLASRTTTWDAVAISAHDDVDPHLAPGLWSIGSFTQADRTYPAGCHTAVVQVDRETGAVELVRLATATDCGTVLHDAVARDQARGAMVQGAAQALFEEVVHDESGTVRTASFADYAVPTAADVPALDVRFVPTPTDRNPLGAKGLGETGMVGAPAAVQNAVIDAVAHLGVTHIDMPCTPLRVWQAIRTADRTA